MKILFLSLFLYSNSSYASTDIDTYLQQFYGNYELVSADDNARCADQTILLNKNEYANSEPVKNSLFIQKTQTSFTRINQGSDIYSEDMFVFKETNVIMKDNIITLNVRRCSYGYLGSCAFKKYRKTREIELYQDSFYLRSYNFDGDTIWSCEYRKM